MLFVSSYDITKRLFAKAIELARQRPDLKILYKGHPREDLSEQVTYLNETFGIENLTVIRSKATAIDLISQSEYVVGVSSTALFESAALGKRVIVLDIPGWEICKELVDRTDALFVSSSADLGTEIDKSKPSENSDYYYSKPVPLPVEEYLRRPRPKTGFWA